MALLHAPQTAPVILYVDLDGVTHHRNVVWHPKRGIQMMQSGHRLFEWLSCLEDIVKPISNASLVLSSAWCVRPGYKRALSNLSPSFRERFIGGTYHRGAMRADPGLRDEFRSSTRFNQIFADVQRRRPVEWLSIDDDTDGWPIDCRRNLIACDGETGLSDRRVQSELREKLNSASIRAELWLRSVC